VSTKSRDPVPTPQEQHLELAEACPWLDPGDRGERLEIHDFPTFLILRLATVTKNNLSRRYLDPFGITMPEWRLIALLARFGTRLFSEVTAGSSMDKGQVSRTLKAIHKKGLVRLNALNASDRPRSSAISPRIQVVISPKGRALFNRILPVARAHQQRLIEMLTPEERTVFHRVTLRLLKQAPSLRDDDP
jgi:DNA-binding MarR family transcriptional regulator